MTTAGVGTDFESLGYSNFDLEYWVYISAPSTYAISVAVDGLLKASTNISGSVSAAQALASAQINAIYHEVPGGPLLSDTVEEVANNSVGTTTNKPYQDVFLQDTNTWFEVQLFASAYDQVSLGSASATASTDPYFFIPVTDPNHQDYMITVSPGILNSPTSSIPELSTWAMLFVGFSGLVFVGSARRRRIHPFSKSLGRMLSE